MDRSVLALLRHFASTAPGATLHEDDDLLMAASHSEYAGPMHNAVIVKRPTGSPRELIDRADRFFGDLSRRYVLWIGAHRVDELESTALSAGLELLGSPRGACAMAIQTPLPVAEATGVEVSPVRSPKHARDFAVVVAEAFAARDRPQPYEATAALFADTRTVLHPEVVAYLALLDGRPAAAAMAFLDGNLATISWVATVAPARSRGLARLVTTTCANAAFRAGAGLVVLQSSAMGEGLYRAMGFAEITRYRRLSRPASPG
jgi:ribosomal protein S18 acetylase RimI-like enzyme